MEGGRKAEEGYASREEDVEGRWEGEMLEGGRYGYNPCSWKLPKRVISFSSGNHPELP